MNAGEPVSLQQVFLLARSQFTAGRLDEAESLCRQILGQHPDQPQTLGLLGSIANRRGKSDEAVQLLRRAVELAPSVPGLQNDLAELLALRGDLEESANCYRQLMSLLPGSAQPAVNLSTVLLRMGKIEPAADAARRAIEINPAIAEAHNALGNALFRLAQFDEAASAYHCAIEFKPAHAAFHSNLGSALQCAGELTEAIAACTRATQINPALVAADNNRIYMLHYHPAYDAASILREQQAWAERHANSLPRFAHPPKRVAEIDRTLRIGYVCPEFRDHITGRYLLPLFREHDRSAFEIVCYSDTTAPDAITDQFRALSHAWRDTARLSDEALAKLIHEDRIDILVDTTLHMAGSRLLAFAWKPAPVQITFAGYPGGTGLEAIDYRLTDPFLDSPATQNAYVERSISLADTFWCYDAIGEHPPVNEVPALSNGFLTFGSLNNFAKANEPALSLWSRVLNAVDRSKLLLLAPAGAPRQRAIKTFNQFGIAPDRVRFVSHQPREAYLRTYHSIDIGLDTFPYNGHMTSLDSLWMGVPVISLVGETAVGRAGWSQLSNLGLNELASSDPDRFVETARSLALDLTRLAQLRASLRQRMLQSPLTDARRYARGVEEAFRRAWQEAISR